MKQKSIAIYIGCLVIIAAILFTMGRTFWCPKGDHLPFTFDANSPHTSQHIFDPYSVTHFEHGLIFFGILILLARDRSLFVRSILTLLLEGSWEILENTSFIIDRYRTATFSLDYYGDSILNSLSDIGFCMLGFAVASKLQWRSVLLLLLTCEGFLILWIKDCLLFNVIMLAHPIDAIKRWQNS